MKRKISTDALFWFIAGLLILLIALLALYYRNRIGEIDRRMREKGVVTSVSRNQKQSQL